MKEFIKAIGDAIIIMLPVILIFHLFYNIVNYKYTAIINDENIKQMKEYLLLNNIELKGELKEITFHSMGWDDEEFILVYMNGEIEKYKVKGNENGEGLSKYIIECSEKNDRLGLRLTMIIISIIASINTIIRLGKTEIIYED